MSTRKRKSLLKEGTVRQFMKYAGLEPLTENFLGTLAEEEPGEDMGGPMPPEEEPMDAAPEPDMGGVDEGTVESLVDAIAAAITDSTGIQVDRVDGGDDLGGGEPGLEPPVDDAPVDDVGAEPPMQEVSKGAHFQDGRQNEMADRRERNNGQLQESGGSHPRGGSNGRTGSGAGVEQGEPFNSKAQGVSVGGQERTDGMGGGPGKNGLPLQEQEEEVNEGTKEELDENCPGVSSGTPFDSKAQGVSVGGQERTDGMGGGPGKNGLPLQEQEEDLEEASASADEEALVAEITRRVAERLVKEANAVRSSGRKRR